MKKDQFWFQSPPFREPGMVVEVIAKEWLIQVPFSICACAAESDATDVM